MTKFDLSGLDQLARAGGPPVAVVPPKGGREGRPEKGDAGWLKRWRLTIEFNSPDGPGVLWESDWYSAVDHLAAFRLAQLYYEKGLGIEPFEPKGCWEPSSLRLINWREIKPPAINPIEPCPKGWDVAETSNEDSVDAAS